MFNWRTIYFDCWTGVMTVRTLQKKSFQFWFNPTIQHVFSWFLQLWFLFWVLSQTLKVCTGEFLRKTIFSVSWIGVYFVWMFHEMLTIFIHRDLRTHFYNYLQVWFLSSRSQSKASHLWAGIPCISFSGLVSGFWQSVESSKMYFYYWIFSVIKLLLLGNDGLYSFVHNRHGKPY